MGISCYQSYKKEKELKNHPKSLNLEQMEYIQEQMKKSVCKIKCNNGGYGSGFFCKIPFPDNFNLLPVLITNYHVISKDDILLNKNINISLNNDKLNINIVMDKSRKIYLNDKLYDITIIELRKNDKIDMN